MDYDELTESYAAHRRHDPRVLEALRRGGRVRRSFRVLEVGCGTGNYVIALEQATGASSIGVDPSAEMLAVARARTAGVRFVLGAAEALPFPDEHFDFVFSIDVIHHVANPAASLAASFRVLRPGGRLCVGTDDEETIRGRLHSRYFPETVTVELARYPPLSGLRSMLAAAGFEEIVEERTASPYRLVDPRPYRERAFSSLHLISAEAFRRGLDRLEDDLARGPIEAVARQLLLWGRKPRRPSVKPSNEG